MKTLLLAGLMLSITCLAHADFDHSTWDGLLKKHVTSLRGGQATQVNYQAFRVDQVQLKRYLQALGQVKPAEFDRWAKPEQLAFLINAYNAATVDLVLSGDAKLKSIKDLGSIFRSPWKKDFVTLLGQTRSLDNIEHDLIRGSGRYNEPRIHFAVNCASVGCPALRSEAFVASRLEGQLEDSTRLFLADQTRNRLDGNTLKVSSIFKWYREDFEKNWRGASSLPQFLGVYSTPLGLDAKQTQALKQGQINVDFLPYDWNLNRKP